MQLKQTSKNQSRTPAFSFCIIVWIKWIKPIYTSNGILFSPEKKGKPAIFNNTDGPWGPYAKWYMLNIV